MIYDFEKDEPIVVHSLDGAVFPALEALMAQEPDISVTVSTAREIYRIRDNLRLLTRGVSEDRTAPTARLAEVGPIVKALFTCDEPERLEAAVARLFPAERFTLSRAQHPFLRADRCRGEQGFRHPGAERQIGESAGIFRRGRPLGHGDDLPIRTVFCPGDCHALGVRRGGSGSSPPPEAGGLARAFRQLEDYLKGGLAAKTIDRGKLQ